MMTILKRTTAIAAIAALPIAAGAAGVQGQKAADSKAQDSSHAAQELQRTIESQVQIPDGSDETGQQGAQAGAVATENAVSSNVASERSTVTRKNGDYVSQAAGTDTGGAEAGASQSTGAQNQAAGQPAAGKAATQGGQQAQSGTATQGDQQGQAAQSGTTTPDDQQGQKAQSGTMAPNDQQGQQGQAAAGDEADATVATVNQKPIKQSEVMGVIAMLPPELQNQPPAVLIPMALDQLVLRELILQQAEKEGLADDQDVRGMAQGTSQESIDDAMVQVWLERNLADAASPQAVQDTYGAIVAQLGDQAPPLDAVRPQIEQELRQQAFAKIADDLQADADIVLFDSEGKPIPPAE